MNKTLEISAMQYESTMNKTLEISAMQYDFHILTNTNQK